MPRVPRKVAMGEVAQPSGSAQQRWQQEGRLWVFRLPHTSHWGHVGAFQLQRSDLLEALEAFRELQVKSTQLPGWWGKEDANRKGP